MLDYVSAKTDTGVIGFEPGQQVKLVEVHRNTRTLVVGDGKAQVEVGPEKLTNDMDVAAMVRQKDQANQTAIAAYMQREQKAYDDAQRAAAVDTQQDIEKINRKEREASTTNSGDSKLNQPPVEVAGGSGYGYAGQCVLRQPLFVLFRVWHHDGGTSDLGWQHGVGSRILRLPAPAGVDWNDRPNAPARKDKPALRRRICPMS